MSDNKTTYFSVLRAIRKASVTGKLDTYIITLNSILSYFINEKEWIYSILGDSKGSKTIHKLHLLKEEINDLYPDIICSYTEYTNIPKDEEINTPPRISDSTLIVNEEEADIPLGKFLKHYEDDQNDSWNSIILYSELTDGKLFYNGIEVSGSIEIDIKGLVSKGQSINVTYNRNESSIRDYGSDKIAFRIKDDNINPLSSTLAFVNIELEPLDNLPPTIGDIDIISEYNVVTVLTYLIFLTQMDPSYSDPEGDEIDAIRIDKIPTSNKGAFLFDGALIQPGLIISADDLRANKLVHRGPQIDSINTDYFEFSVRDVGSLIWVS